MLSQTDAELTAVALLSRAEEVEQREPGYRAELDQWLRTDPGAPDGIPVEAVPEDPATSNWLIRDFLVGQRVSQQRTVPADDDPAPAVERPTVLLMGTSGDDRYAWVQAGRALGRVLLRATVAGLAASPLTQALDWPTTRTRMTALLSLVGHPQMLLRIGLADQPGDRDRAASRHRGAAPGRVTYTPDRNLPVPVSGRHLAVAERDRRSAVEWPGHRAHHAAVGGTPCLAGRDGHREHLRAASMQDRVRRRALTGSSRRTDTHDHQLRGFGLFDEDVARATRHDHRLHRQCRLGVTQFRDAVGDEGTLGSVSGRGVQTPAQRCHGVLGQLLPRMDDA
ncbi:MAG: hypothetical protein JWP46_2924 [Modestobacter sp.]|nr:hypothetical protein [Modestobacter sp.]